jgi:hypothetical protein
VQKPSTKHVLRYYLRDDGELMLEIRPGEFISETAARQGLAHPKLLAEVHRIKGRLSRAKRANPKPPH